MMARVVLRMRRAAVAVCVAMVLQACSGGLPWTDGPAPTSPYRQSQEEFLDAMVACLREKGYSARIEEDGLRVAGVRDRATASEDHRDCQASIDPGRLSPPALTRTQLEAMYRYTVAQIDCMRQAGYPVSDPPSREAYVGSQGRAFDPYLDLRQRGIDFSHEDLLRCQDVEERPDFLDW